MLGVMPAASLCFGGWPPEVSPSRHYIEKPYTNNALYKHIFIIYPPNHIINININPSNTHTKYITYEKFLNNGTNSEICDGYYCPLRAISPHTLVNKQQLIPHTRTRSTTLCHISTYFPSNPYPLPLCQAHRCPI